MLLHLLLVTAFGGGCFDRFMMEEGNLGGRATQDLLSLLLVMFCGIGGFSDFYKLPWLEAILSWQKPQEGCFGKPGELPFPLVGPDISKPGGEMIQWC